jgi:hypothetical protein
MDDCDKHGIIMYTHNEMMLSCTERITTGSDLLRSNICVYYPNIQRFRADEIEDEMQMSAVIDGITVALYKPIIPNLVSSFISKYTLQLLDKRYIGYNQLKI